MIDSSKPAAIPMAGKRLIRYADQDVIAFKNLLKWLNGLIKVVALLAVFWIVYVLYNAFVYWQEDNFGVAYFHVSTLFFPFAVLFKIKFGGSSNGRLQFLQSITFDYNQQIYYSGKEYLEASDSITQGSFSDIKCLKLSEQENEDLSEEGGGGTWKSHRLDLVKRNEEVFTLINHSETELVDEDAWKLASRLNVRLFDVHGIEVRNSGSISSERIPLRSNQRNYGQEIPEKKSGINFKSIGLLLVMIMTAFSFYQNTIGHNPAHMSAQIPEQYIKAAITQYYDKRWATRDISMSAIDKIMLVPISKTEFDVHAAYTFNNLEYNSLGKDRRVFRIRINAGNDSISVLKMGNNRSANFVWAKIRYGFSRLF